MSAELPLILLVGRGFTPGSQFLERLCRNGCACTVAHSLDEASNAIRCAHFDVVLSEMGLPEGSAFPLIALLERTPATLFFCVGVHESCWWLPALERGRRTWGQAALRPAEFAVLLATLLGTDALRAAVPAADAVLANVISMPPIEIAPPKPERAPTEEAQSRKSSA
jgi:CheY-like chemotaxis protein